VAAGVAAPPDVAGGEDRLIAWLRRREARGREELIGDDATLGAPAADLAVSVDQQVEGVHFSTGLDPRLLGRRLVAVCLSDLAAVGADPLHAWLALSAPTGFDYRRLLDGVLEACRRHGLRLAGGDLARGAGVRAALTVAGRRPPRGRWLRRSAARAGDRLWLAGSLGESALGRILLERGARADARGVALPRSLERPAALAAAARRAVRRHLEPTPQLALGRWLARRRRAAAIDVSDGLALDLHRLCRESGTGAAVTDSALPTSAAHRRLCSRLGLDAERLALAGGEDYALLFALPPTLRVPAVYAARAIGEITARRRVELRRAAGGAEPLPAAGWDHLA